MAFEISIYKRNEGLRNVKYTKLSIPEDGNALLSFPEDINSELEIDILNKDGTSFDGGG